MHSLKDYLAADAGLDTELARLIEAMAEACAEISATVAKGALGGLLGAAGAQNIQGEAQQKLDVLADNMLREAAEASGLVAGVASEEMDTIHVTEAGETAGYLLLYDPLDGSSNIDVNVSIGTILSILPAPKGRAPTEADFLQPGSRQAAAAYAVYGPQCVLVLTVGKGVAAFTLDPASRQFVITEPKLTVPVETKEYSINASNSRHWEPGVQAYVAGCVAGADGPRGKNFNMRWVGSMVADVHRVLSRGGIFLYPWDKREPAKPGKLRLMYEANPMALLVEQAGGAATDGRRRILDIQPKALHERVAVVLGSRGEVEQVSAALAAPVDA